MSPHSAIIDAAVDALMQQGFTRLAAMQMAEEALEEVRAKQRASATTERILATPYQAWLKSASPEYVWSKPVHRVLCNHIDDIIAGRIRRLAIFMPPRVGKSEAVTVRLPVYWQEAFPGSRVIIGAYNRDLATLFTRNSLRLFRARNPDMVESEAQDEWTTKAGGSVLAAGVGSGVTGRGADLILVDDPVRGYEEAVSLAYQNRVWQWWQNDMRTRVNNIDRTPICLILTRWHEMDLAGRILDQDKRGLWKVLSFPALATEDDILGRKPGESIWPERLPEAELEELRAEMGVRFDALYQQDPTPAEGGLINESWFWKSEIGSRQIVAEVRAWDIAATSVSRKSGSPDWTAGARMALVQADKDKYVCAIRDMARIRAEVGDRDTFIQSVALADGPEVLQVFEEGDDGDKAVTHALRQMLAPHGIGVEGVKPRNDKVVRSTNARSALQRGEMFMCDGRWNYDFVSEMVRFPNGRHDDQVDAWSLAYNHLIIRAVKVSIR